MRRTTIRLHEGWYMTWHAWFEQALANPWWVGNIGPEGSLWFEVEL